MIDDTVEQLARWLHDETGHPDSYPDHTWPETERDDGRREGGWVKIVPQHAQAYFRDIARRMVARFPLKEPQAVEVCFIPPVGTCAVCKKPPSKDCSICSTLPRPHGGRDDALVPTPGAACDCLMCLAEGDNSPHRRRSSSLSRPAPRTASDSDYIEKLKTDVAFCREAMRHADIDLSMVLPLVNADMQKEIRKTLARIDEAKIRSLSLSRPHGHSRFCAIHTVGDCTCTLASQPWGSENG
jgi:hypothetical protein